MPDREQQIHPVIPRPGTPPLPTHPVSAPIVAAPRARRRDQAIAQRLRHGLLRLPLGSERPPRW
jgi:hypothetical protein